MILHRAFKYRLNPTDAQSERLRQWEGAARFLWNIALDQRRQDLARCKVDRRYPNYFDQSAELSELRNDLPWLADLPYNVCQQVLKELDLAWQRWVKGLAEFPRFKRKGRDRGTLVEPHHGQFRVAGEGRTGSVTFPKMGRLPAVLHRPVAGTAKTCALTFDGQHWYASLSCDVEFADPLPSIKPPVAIDRGVVNLIADSNGQVVENPRHLEAAQKRLARAQRAVSRKKKGSKNQQRARAKVARLHRTVARQRNDTLHRASKTYAQNHGTVVVEALKVSNMTASAKGTVEEPGVNVRQKAGLNRAILDSGWSRFVAMVSYKVVPEGGRVVSVPPAYSSQTCSACGVVDAESRRAQDVFLCRTCGYFANADINAAKVLLVRGMHAPAVEATVAGCGGSPARGAPAKHQLRTVRRAPRAMAGAKAPCFSKG